MKKTNSGSCNSGSCNSGSWNSGSCNSGFRNSGSWNSGSCNSSSWNSGSWNSGSWNSGSWNSGSWNSGSWNSGSWNSGSWNSGFFNTNEPTIRMFNKDTNKYRKDIIIPNWIYNLILEQWINFNDMNDQEKKDYPKAYVTDGYLKTYTYKKAWSNLWNTLTDIQKKEVFTLSNFDAKIFEEITGINVNSQDDNKKKELLSKADELIQKANELMKQAEKM